MKVSIILPALNPDIYFARCFRSILAAMEGFGGWEILVVCPDKSLFGAYQGPRIKIINESGPGIYRSMNDGLEFAEGDYIYFIGQDDILLPSFRTLVASTVAEGPDLILGNVFFGDSGVYKNSCFLKFRPWRNWCHQGIVYKKKAFQNIVGVFSEDFILQADHHANVILAGSSGIRISRFRKCIAWYSDSGKSSYQTDPVFRDRFPIIVRNQLSYSVYLVVLARRFFRQIYNFTCKERGGDR